MSAFEQHTSIPPPPLYTTASAIYFFKTRLESLEKLVCALVMVSGVVVEKLGEDQSLTGFALQGVVDAIFSDASHMLEMADKMESDPKWAGVTL